MKILFNILKVIGLIALSLTCNIIPMILLKRQADLSDSVKWLAGIIYIVFIVTVITLLWKWYRKVEDSEVASQKMTGKDVGIDFLYFLAARVVAIVGTVLIQVLSGQKTTANDAALQSLTDFFKGGFFLYTLLYVVLVGIVGPIIEELAYRAFPNNLLFKHHHKILAGIVTTAVFALPHATNLSEFLLYAALGSILYLSYARRGNIKDSMLVHILNNLPSAIYFLVLAFR